MIYITIMFCTLVSAILIPGQDSYSPQIDSGEVKKFRSICDELVMYSTAFIFCWRVSFCFHRKSYKLSDYNTFEHESVQFSNETMKHHYSTIFCFLCYFIAQPQSFFFFETLRMSSKYIRMFTKVKHKSITLFRCYRSRFLRIRALSRICLAVIICGSVPVEVSKVLRSMENVSQPASGPGRIQE